MWSEHSNFDAKNKFNLLIYWISKLLVLKWWDILPKSLDHNSCKWHTHTHSCTLVISADAWQRLAQWHFKQPSQSFLTNEDVTVWPDTAAVIFLRLLSRGCSPTQPWHTFTTLWGPSPGTCQRDGVYIPFPPVSSYSNISAHWCYGRRREVFKAPH